MCGYFNSVSPTPPFGFGDLLDATVRAVAPDDTPLPGWTQRGCATRARRAARCRSGTRATTSGRWLSNRRRPSPVAFPSSARPDHRGHLAVDTRRAASRSSRARDLRSPRERGAVGGVNVNLATGESHGQGDDRLVGVEGIIGSDHADYLRSVGCCGEVHAGKGNDRLVSATGRERLLGGGGVDHLVLGAGDFGYGNAGDDVLRMKATGHAIAEGDGGDDTFVGGPGPDTFYGFYGSGTGDQDVARGHGGSDVIALGIGNDLSVGGSGADHIMAGPGDDLVDGGKGRDRYSGGSLTADGFRVDLRLGTATGGGTGVDRLTSIRDLDGSADDDVLIGNRYANDIFAGPGDDHLSGGAGDDVLNGFDDVDRADGGPGTDTCVAELRRRCEG